MSGTTAHKFGGASVKDAAAIKRVAELLQGTLGTEEHAVVVVSAMGKTTNALEEVWLLSHDPAEQKMRWQALLEEHVAVADALALPESAKQALRTTWTACWDEAKAREGDRMACYDAMVAAGELASTQLVAGWLTHCGVDATWWDVRETLRTVGPHQFARVEEHLLGEMGTSLRAHFDKHRGERHVVVAQGFIGRHGDGSTSTLGREGSDYSVALLAVAVGAGEVTIWKDVPGMMNADPRIHPEAVTVPRVDHAEAIELSYYGASVIHPRTIKPLRGAGIPLWVKSFKAPQGPSTCIDAFDGLVPEVPMFIWREDQARLEVFTQDGSFLAEDHLTTLFGALDHAGIHVRLMQQSATHFGLVMDADESKVERLEAHLQGALDLQVTRGLKLLTVRHGDHAVVERLTQGQRRLIEQRTADTWRLLLAPSR